MGSDYLDCLVPGCGGYLHLLVKEEEEGVAVYRCNRCGAVVTVAEEGKHGS